MLIASVHATVQFADGTIWIHAANTDLTLASTDPTIVHTLAAFRRPADADAIIVAAVETDMVSSQIAELQRIGALIPAVSDAPPEPAPGELVGRYLSPVAEALDTLAGALAGIGPAGGV